MNDTKPATGDDVRSWITRHYPVGSVTLSRAASTLDTQDAELAVHAARKSCARDLEELERRYASATSEGDRAEFAAIAFDAFEQLHAAEAELARLTSGAPRVAYIKPGCLHCEGEDPDCLDCGGDGECECDKCWSAALDAEFDLLGAKNVVLIQHVHELEAELARLRAPVGGEAEEAARELEYLGTLQPALPDQLRAAWRQLTDALAEAEARAGGWEKWHRYILHDVSPENLMLAIRGGPPIPPQEDAAQTETEEVE